MRKEDKNRSKFIAIYIVGALTLLYSLAEIAVAVYVESLALISDGFHNLSDVIALIIAFWALKVRTRSMKLEPTVGSAREISFTFSQLDDFKILEI